MLIAREMNNQREYLQFGDKTQVQQVRHLENDGEYRVHININYNMNWISDIHHATVWPTAIGEEMLNKIAPWSTNARLIGVEFEATPMRPNLNKDYIDSSNLEFKPVEDSVEDATFDTDLKTPVQLTWTDPEQYEDLKESNPDLVETVMYINASLFEKGKLIVTVPFDQVGNVVCATVRNGKVSVLAKKQVKLDANVLQ